MLPVMPVCTYVASRVDASGRPIAAGLANRFQPADNSSLMEVHRLQIVADLIAHPDERVGVRLGYDQGWIALSVSVSVSDNGRGFDATRTADQTAAGGFGLLAPHRHPRHRDTGMAR